MKSVKEIFAVAIFVLASIADLAQATEIIKYISYTTKGFQAIFENRYKMEPVVLEGVLHLPKGNGPFPAIVLQHGTGRVDDYMPWMKRIIP